MYKHINNIKKQNEKICNLIQYKENYFFWIHNVHIKANISIHF